MRAGASPFAVGRRDDICEDDGSSGGPRGGHPRRWSILAALWLCLLVIGFDATILNVALPTLAGELDASTAELQWIVDAYVLVFAALLVAAGTLGDRIGRRRLLLAGLIVFGVASALSAASPSPGALIAARALMGLGAAIIAPLTLGILPTVFAPHERPKAIAAWAAGAAIGIPLGPILGGLLLEHLWWGSVFLVNVPVIAVALLACAALIPESRDPTARPLDLPAVGLSAAGLAAIVYGLIEAGRKTLDDPVVIAALVGGALVLAAFVRRQRRSVDPLIELGSFSDVRFFAWATAATALASFALFGLLFVVPQYLQLVRGYSTLDTGLGVLPLLAGLGIGAGAGNTLVARLGTKAMVAGGLAVLGAGLLLLSTVTADSGYALVAGALAIAGLGLGLTLGPSYDGIMRVLPLDRVGAGTGLNLAARQLGGALGIAMLGSVLARAYAARLDPSLEGLPVAARDAARESLAAAIRISERMPAAPGQELRDAAERAFVHGMDTLMLVCAATMLAGTVLVGRFLTSRPRPAPAGTQAWSGARARVARDSTGKEQRR